MLPRFENLERKWKTKREVQIGPLDPSYLGPTPNLATSHYVEPVRFEGRLGWDGSSRRWCCGASRSHHHCPPLTFFFPPLSPFSTFLLFLVVEGAYPGPRKPPILPNLSGSRGGSGEMGAHGDGVAELHVPAIVALLWPFFSLSLSFFLFPPLLSCWRCHPPLKTHSDLCYFLKKTRPSVRAGSVIENASRWSVIGRAGSAVEKVARTPNHPPTDELSDFKHV